jgi:hypothetical protein
MRFAATLFALLFIVLSAAAAENYGGTYTAEGAKGTVSLVLTQEKDDSITGTMSAAGARMLIRAKLTEGKAVGVMAPEGGQGGGFFLAQKEGAKLAVAVGDFDANGRPRLETARSIAFTVANPPANAAAAPPAPTNPLARDDGYAGTFKDDSGRLAVEIQPAQGQYTGTIRLGDQKFPFKASAKDGQLQGTFESDGNNFDFTASLNNNQLTLKAGNTTYLLEKERKAVNPLEKPAAANPLEKPAPPNPLDKPAAANTPADAAARADDKWVPLARGKVYKHPTGGMLRYPEDWQVKETDAALQLIPPNQGNNPEAFFLVTAEDARGITRPDDPRLIQLIDVLIAQQAPLLRRVGEVESVKSGSQPGAAMVWEATGPTGIVVRANLYVTIVQGKAVSLLGIGTKPRVIEQDKTLREIFSTFAFGQAQIDRELLGTWHYWNYTSSAGGAASTETRRTCVLKEDGTFTWAGNSEGYLSATNKNSLGEVTSSATAVGNRGDGAKGTWAAGDGKLYLNHDDGTYVALKYQIKGQKGNRFLYIDAGGKKPQEWSENKVN